MTTHPPRPVASLSGTYSVVAPAWVTDEDCRNLIESLEQAGAIPFRSVARGRLGAALALGGEGMEIELQGRKCGIMIFGSTIGVIPQPGQ